VTAATRARSADRIDALRGEGRAALIGYLPVGFPDVAGSVAAATAMVEAGVDMIELGIAYSDPVMDGPVIQDAVQRVL
jgi:tryptophan synthase alpha chain